MADSTSPPIYRRRIVPVADADAVLQDLRFGARTGTLGNIAMLAIAGGLVMSREAVAEVDRGIVKVARDEKQAAAMRSAWGRMRLHIAIHDPTPADLDCDAARQLADRDPKDLHVLAAAASRPNAVILTGDTDLTDLNLAPAGWLDTSRALMPVVVTDNAIHFGVTGVQTGLAALADLCTAAAGGSSRARVSLAALIAAIIWALADGDRRAWIGERAVDLVAAGGTRLQAEQVILGALSPHMGASIVAEQSGDDRA